MKTFISPSKLFFFSLILWVFFKTSYTIDTFFHLMHGYLLIMSYHYTNTFFSSFYNLNYNIINEWFLDFTHTRYKCYNE